jgi:hypothetical protein
MAAPAALREAIALLRAPTLARTMRARRLPADVLTLIRIAAADPEAMVAAAEETGEPGERLREAAILYLQSILLAQDADPYRTLGVERDAAQADLRLHFGWLMKWLHPDRTGNQWDSAFAGRVLAAWNALKTTERREAYDRAAEAMPKGAPRSSRRRKSRLVVLRRAPPPRPRARPAWRLGKRGLIAAGLGVMLATVVWAASVWLSGHERDDASPDTSSLVAGSVSLLQDVPCAALRWTGATERSARVSA